MSQTIVSFKYDKYFLPLSSDEEVKNKLKEFSKVEFKKFMEMEKKKGEFNEKLSQYSIEYEKTKNKMKNYKEEIKLNNEVIQQLNNQVNTFTGPIREIQSQVQEYNKKIRGYKNDNFVIEENKNNLFREFTKANKEFERKAFVSHMQIDNYIDSSERKEREKEEGTDPKWKRFLYRLNALPDEILRIIRTYFTYETRAALLEKYYQPIKLFQSLPKNVLKMAIYKIYRKYHTTCKNESLKKIMMETWKRFYKDSIVSDVPYHSASLSDMKHMIEFLFYLFRTYNRPRYAYELYRMISIMKKPKTK